MYKLLYVSGSRAEYGIMKRLLTKFKNDEDIDFKLAVTAMHLEKEYGNTYKYIEEDGFEIDAKIPINLDSSSNGKIIESMATCQKEFGFYFEKNNFDAVIILGDRYEMLAVSTAAAIHNIPIIHLHGGEITLGNYDEFIRHCITKMSKLHLTSTEEYRNRVIQLGEKPESVINTGALGAENSLLLNLPQKDNLEYKFGELDNYFMVVFHPETLLTTDSVEKQINILLDALSEFKNLYDFVFIGSNSDTGSDKIMLTIEKFCNENNYRLLKSTKPEEYLALNKYSNGLIGNSSSGLIEIPSLNIPTINIGNRQKGRVRGISVIDTKVNVNDIINSIKISQSSEFLEKIKFEKNPYLQNNVLEKCYNAITDFLGKEKRSFKEFHDLDID